MNNNTQVLPGFISVDDAVAIIKKHKPNAPTVDLYRLMKGRDYILKGNNFSIFQRKVVNGVSVSAGSVPCTVHSQYEAELLKKTLADKFAEVVGHEFDEVRMRTQSTTTVVSEGNMSPKPRRSKKKMLEPGAEISSGATLGSEAYKNGGASMLSAAVEN